MNAIRLGVALACRGGRATVVRLLAMALGMVAVGFSAAALSAVPGLLDGSATRGLTLATAESPGSALRGAQIEDAVGDRVLTRIAIAGSGSVPGVAILPRPGEIVWSRALARLAASDPLVAQRFPQRAIGTVHDDALTEPGQLVAIVGVDTDHPSLTPITFGSLPEGRGASVVDPRLVRNALVLAAVFLLLPAIVFLATSARLSARAREQLLSSLRLLGLRPRTVRLVNAVEPAAVAAVGSLLGVGLWWLVRDPLGRRGVGGFRWFGADAPLNLPVVMLIVVVSMVLAVIVGTVSQNAAIDAPLGARRAQEPTLRLPWRAVVLVTGIGLLVGVSARGAGAASSQLLLWLFVGGLLSLIGTALATPVVARALGSGIARLGKGPLAILVSRRLQHEPSVSSRIVSGLLVTTFCFGAAQGVVGAFRDVIDVNDDERVHFVSANLSREQLGSLPGFEAAVAGVSDGEGGPSAVGTCADIRALYALPLPECVEGVPVEIVDARSASSIPGAAPRSGYPPVTVQPLDASVVATGVMVPPGTPGVAPSGSWVVRIEPSRLPEFRAALAGADAAGWAGFPGTDSLYQRVSALVIAGAFVAFVLGFGAVIVAAADRAVERQRLDAQLVAVGLSNTLLRRAQLAATVLPMACAVVFAAIAGGVTGHLYRRSGSSLDQVPSFPWSTLGQTAALGLFGVALAGAMAWTLARARLTPSMLRTE